MFNVGSCSCPHLCSRCVRACLCTGCEGLRGGGGEACNRLVAGGPVTFGSVRHGSSPISSSPLLLLPLFFSSSNSIAIKELRRDPNAASSVIKTISCEDGLCHLNCLFRAHVTPNSPCVAGLSEDINSLPARFVQQFTQPVSSSCHFCLNDTSRILYGHKCMTPTSCATSVHRTNPLHTARPEPARAYK